MATTRRSSIPESEPATNTSLAASAVVGRSEATDATMPGSLPVPSAPLSPERLAEHLRHLDLALAAAVLFFAFLTASFPVRNSDFFLHLASGRLLAQGQYSFGKDPFTFTTDGVYWANHAWLFDLLLYGIYSIPEIGGIVVVVCKALLVAALAGVMLQSARRSARSLWIPAACVLLAVLTLSPRLLLQSVGISYLFLGLTLQLLLRPTRRGEDMVAAGPPSRSRWRSWWLLPPLFLLWVNLDAWFLLGPITVAVYLLGQAMQVWLPRAPAVAVPSPPGQFRTLVLVLMTGLAACAINPHHLHAFTLPWELGLSSASKALTQDSEFRSLFDSPLEQMALQRLTSLNIAALAYIPLALLGIVSFALTWGAWRWWRVLIWLGFFLLSLTTYRAVPFFAIVAGPIMSLNILDFAAQRFGVAPRMGAWWIRWSLVGRSLTVLAALLLLAATVPGWLQGQAARRPVGWGVRIDPSLRQAAVQIRAWRDQGLIGSDERLFNTLPDLASYLAWFCPGEKCFMDLRLPLFPKTAHDFVAIRQALASEEGQVNPAWRSVFRKWDIRFLVFHTRDPRQPTSQVAFERLLLNPDGWRDEWTLCYLDGRTVIAGWKDRGQGSPAEPYEPLRLHMDQLAFGTDVNPEPAATTKSRSQIISLWQSAPEPSLQADEAFLHLMRYEALGPRTSLRNQREWETVVATALIGSSAARGGPLVNGSLLFSRLDFTYRQLHGLPLGPAGAPPQQMDRLAHQLLNTYRATKDSGPPASLFLCLRAARQAVAANPDDARSYLLLGQCYVQLAWKTRELERGRAFPEVALIRQAQAVTALEQAVRLNPDLERAHDLLANLYQNAVYLPPQRPGQPPGDQLWHRPNLELELKHRREQVRCAIATGPQLDEPPPQFAQRIERMEKEVQRLAARLSKLFDEWEVVAAEKPLPVKTELALERGLSETGLNLLLRADVKDWFSGPHRAPGALRVFELLLSMGRLEEAQELLMPQNRQILGMMPAPLDLPAYDWLQIQIAAAGGDYEQADQHLAAISATPRAKGVTPSSLLAQVIGHQLLWDAPLATGMPWQVVRKFPPLIGLPPQRTTTLTLGLKQSLLLLQQETDVQALRGWLAVEAGAIPQARQHFLQVLRGSASSHMRTASDPILLLRARPLALLYTQWLDTNE